MILFLSPLPEILNARSSGNNGKLNSLPHIMLLSQALSWVCYSLIVKNPVIGCINITGTFISFFYILSAMANIKEKEAKLYLDFLFIFGMSSPIIIYMIIIYWVDVSLHLSIFGIVAVTFNLALYVAPLSTLYTIILSRDASPISFHLSCAGLFCTTTWGLYAIGIGDNFLLIPQAGGFALNCIFLHFYSCSIL